MFDSSELRKGGKFEIDGEPFLVVEAQFVKPGKGNAFTRTRIKSLITGNVIERTFRSGEKVDECQLEEKPMEFLYASGDDFTFMDTANYEQLTMDRAHVGDAALYLTENLSVSILFHNGKPLTINLPNFVELQVVECDPATKGDTKINARKKAKLMTGAEVEVPMFVDNNEWLRIDTRDGSFVERVKK